MKILFATDHIHHPQGAGGAERSTHELCLALQERGHIAAVLSSMRPDGSFLSWKNRILRKLQNKEFPKDTTCGYPTFRGWNMDKIGEVVNAFTPDIVVVQSTTPGKIIDLLKKHKTPVVAYIREVERLDGLEQELKNIPIIANSPFTAQRIQEHCGLHATPILPLVERACYETQCHPQNALFVNTVPRKGLEIAFAIAKARPDIHFDFVRAWILDHSATALLHERADKCGNVCIHEPTKDMRPLYAQARLVLAPSLWEEAWGRIATEAHFNAIPVLGSDRGGLPQAIGPGGIIVPAQAPVDEWIQAFNHMWDNPSIYTSLSQAAKKYALRQEITPDYILGQLENVLNLCIQTVYK
jgi:glycosyltransferase involved in cell wall biosynthesis